MTIFKVFPHLLQLTAYDFCMFSCCAASRFIKFITRETRWLVIFPQRPPRRQTKFLRHHRKLQAGKPRGSRRTIPQDHATNQTDIAPHTYLFRFQEVR